MKYFKHPENNDVYAYSVDGSQDSLINPTLIPISEEDADKLRAIPQPKIELSVSARSRRDKLIAATDYMVMPDYPLSESELATTKQYRQALRDITKQTGFPDAIEWPHLSAR